MIKMIRKWLGIKSPSGEWIEAGAAAIGAMTIHREYRICEADYASGLAQVVETHLKEGWELAGGVSAADSSTGSGCHRKYIQAVYREYEKCQ